MMTTQDLRMPFLLRLRLLFLSPLPLLRPHLHQPLLLRRRHRQSTCLCYPMTRRQPRRASGEAPHHRLLTDDNKEQAIANIAGSRWKSGSWMLDIAHQDIWL